MDISRSSITGHQIILSVILFIVIGDGVKKANQGYCLSGMFSSERQYNHGELIEGVINSDPPQKAYNESCLIYTGIKPLGR